MSNTLTHFQVLTQAQVPPIRCGLAVIQEASQGCHSLNRAKLAGVGGVGGEEDGVMTWSHDQSLPQGMLGNVVF